MTRATMIGGSWMEKLLAPNWDVRPTFGGVPGASLVSHTKLAACFLVLHNICHYNYDLSYDGYQGGAWYSMDGHNLSQIIPSGFPCRILPEHYDYPTISGMLGRRGRLVSWAQRDEEIAQEERDRKIPPERRWNGSRTLHERATVANMDPFPGHIVYDWAMLADYQYALWTTLGRPPEESLLLDELVYFFPAVPPKRTRNLANRVLRQLFGRDLGIMIGKGREGHAHICFKEVLFPLVNSNFLIPNESMDHFKKLMYSMLAKPQSPVPPAPPMYQVTWLWRTSRRYMTNAAALLHELVAAFQNFPLPGESLPIKVVEFDDSMPLEEVVDIMRHTAFGIGMHGAAMFQETFMPVGSRLLELLCFKCSEITFQPVGQSLGVQHHTWLDTQRDKMRYDNDCFKDEWHALTDFDCVRTHSCFVCTKDHPITTVNVTEVRQQIEEIKPGLREWILERRKEDLEQVRMFQLTRIEPRTT
eukprot:TRINITY_DN9680_c0_g2_i1.p1 TRINITY_DN9680_c0_g2~~TRINITY_DN9680_c0_g2_i1.p1  ORF type:complete len:473 (-),score=71.07 TRINITY_DN9680_c0_g2_i1:148-1566(-)